MARFHKSVTATYCSAKPSFFSNGHILECPFSPLSPSLKQFPHLKTATLLKRMPHSQSSPTPPLSAPDMSRVAGISGSSTDFSCTWNENRKNDSEEVSSAYGTSTSVGHEIWTRFLSCILLSVLSAADQAPYRSPHTMGAKPAAVQIVDKRTSHGAASHRRHLTTTSLAHQKLATLSSKRPRLKGKMRESGLRMAVGLNHGRKSRRTVRIVVAAKRKNRLRLEQRREDSEIHKG
jgi:hypothetical protein